MINVTPDSFFAESRSDEQTACRRIDRFVEAGVWALDIGGESTRPGALTVSDDEQIARLEPVVRYAVSLGGAQVSVDTTRSRVAERMLSLGAHAINDVSCLADPAMVEVVARHRAALVLMHSRGAMCAMAGFSEYPEDGYRDIVGEVAEEWWVARERAVGAGVDPESILFDPGLGFHKSARHSLWILTHLAEFLRLGAPIVVGPGRKSFLRLVEDVAPEARLGATVSACLVAAEQGAMAVRVHDVAVVGQALKAQRLFREQVVGRTKREVPCSKAC